MSATDDADAIALPPLGQLPGKVRRPAIVSWNRLEPRPRTREFSRSLRADVRDALWLLTRQWQLGEFAFEDAATVVFARVNIQSTRLTTYAAGGGSPVSFDERPPLEARVEREQVPLDTLTRAELGQLWLRLLQAAGADEATLDFFRAAFPFATPGQPSVAEAERFSNRLSWQLRAALAGRGLDGGALLDALASGSAADIEHDGTLPPPGDRARIERAQAQLLQLHEGLFTQPHAGDPVAWNPHQLEYQFTCSAPEPDGSSTVLVAAGYPGGHLDWHAFDRAGAPGGDGGGEAPDGVVGSETRTFLPAAARFDGMPSPRWWELEDQRTDFGAIEPATTDLARLLMAEFALVFSGDWMVFPFELAVGSLARVGGLVVVDAFGERQLIPAAGEGPQNAWQRWGMYGLSRADLPGAVDQRLFLPPVIGKLLEGEPIEEVRLFRDEMANMVWAVETRLPDDLAGGRDGFEAAADRLALIRGLLPPAGEPPTAPTGAPVRYVAGTTVPENMIPFLPMHVPGSNRQVQLRRGAMARTMEGLPPSDVEPRGDLLRPPGEDPYHVNEEEILPEGEVLTRTFQRTRGPAGETYLWLGRRKRTGRDSRTSGLRFDQVVERQPPA